MSLAQSPRLRAYRALRREFLTQHPACESPWPCGQPATEVHHRMGRTGRRLLDTQWWGASCHHCNTVRTEQTHTAQAWACNWRISPDFTGQPEDAPILPLSSLIARSER